MAACFLLIVAVSVPTPAAALTGMFVAQIGNAEGECRTDLDASRTGEYLATKLKEPNGEPYDGQHHDWLFHLYSRDAGGYGLSRGEFSGDTITALPDNFTYPLYPTDVILAIVTFPDGHVYLNSFYMALGFAFADTSRQQRVGDTPPPSLTNVREVTQLVLPDEPAPWMAELDTGVSRFPRRAAGWPELAFAPLREGDQYVPGSCRVGGVHMDPNGSGHLLGGYIIYRMATSGWRPTADEVAQQENWVDFVPLPVDEGSQAVWHDPDGLPRTGDEVIAWHDAPFARNGEWRRYGHYPQLGAGLTWWYVVQPAARGTVNEFEGVSLAKGPVDDFRVDLDGDGLFDAVDLHGSNGEDGPEFVSPQAEAGASGLGLTHDRRPIVSKLMAWNDCLLAGGAESLRVTKQGLHWSGQRDVLDWEVRRAVVPERLAVVPAAGELRTWRVRGDASTDPVAEPGPTGLVCYRIQPLCQP